MAANPLPLLALAGAAFFMASKSKGGSGPAQSAGQNPGANPPFLLLNSDCGPIAVPTDEAEKKRQAEAIRTYIGRRAVELYQQLNAGAVPVRVRFNSGPLTAEQKAHIKEQEVEAGPIAIHEDHVVIGLDGAGDLYAAIYDELVPAACAQKLVWHGKIEGFDPIFPSPAAACIAAAIRVQVNQTLAPVASDELPAMSVGEIAETMLACIGINLDLDLGG